MKKTILLFGLILALYISSNAQQDPMYTQYMFNTLSVNPAYAGSRGQISALLLSRHQWIGFNGAPETQTFLIHAPLDHYNSGIGMSLVSDKIGPNTQSGLYFDYSYHLKFDNEKQLSIGLKGGFNMYQSNVTGLKIHDLDNLFTRDVRGSFMPNFGFGLYYYTPKYYLGVSAPKLVNNVFTSDETFQTRHVSKEERHYFFIGGYVMDINKDIKFRPSYFVKLVSGAPISIDINANVLLKEKIWLGVMHRFGDAYGAMVQFQFNKNLRAGYSYDYSYSILKNYSPSSHELMIGYDFSIKKNKIVSPRYF